MTTPTPTSELSLPGELNLSDGLSLPPQTGLSIYGPAEAAELARLANVMFAALPGAAQPTAVAAGVPAGVPAGKAGAAAAPVGAPGAGAIAVPAPGSAGSGLAVPSNPSLQPPFYFLDFAGPPSEAVENGVRRATGVASLAQRSPALPGAEALRASLASLTRAPEGAAAGTGAAAPQPASFYFLDPAVRGAAAQAARHAGAHPPFDVTAVRADFPILRERINGRPLIWLDNAATTQKPQAVIDRIAWFYAHENSNIHRAAHTLAARSTDAYEGARRSVQRFLGASSADEIVFVRGATEAINLVAQSWGRRHVQAGDEILISHLEHHANIVPWQQLALEKGARLRVAPVDDSGQILMEEYQRLLGERTRIVALTQVSNALGTIAPVQQMTQLARRAGAHVLIDGAQAVSHMPVDVQALGADFYVFSGHKIFGPTGIGVLYGRSEVLEAMPPWQGGGNMISSVTFERTTYQQPPARFEAGTGNIADAAGLGAALEYLERIGMPLIERYEKDLLAYATAGLGTVPGLHLIGTAAEKASVLSFVLDGHDPVAVGSALNEEGIAVRAGHHCAEPILRRFGVSATVRPSLAFYNTCAEVDALIAALRKLTGNSPRRTAARL